MFTAVPVCCDSGVQVPLRVGGDSPESGAGAEPASVVDPPLEELPLLDPPLEDDPTGDDPPLDDPLLDVPLLDHPPLEELLLEDPPDGSEPPDPLPLVTVVPPDDVGEVAPPSSVLESVGGAPLHATSDRASDTTRGAAAATRPTIDVSTTTPLGHEPRLRDTIGSPSRVSSAVHAKDHRAERNG